MKYLREALGQVVWPVQNQVMSSPEDVPQIPLRVSLSVETHAEWMYTMLLELAYSHGAIQDSVAVSILALAVRAPVADNEQDPPSLWPP